MADLMNRRLRLIARPTGEPKRSDFNLTTDPVPDLEEGQVLVKVLYLSMDPAMRGWMSEKKSYVPPIPLGDVVRALGVGKVVASKNKAFSEGDYVNGLLGAQEYAILGERQMQGGLVRIDPRLAPLPVWLNTLGMPGMTGYFGLLDVGQAREGETVLVSGAAGAVGQAVGQIAKIKGCRAIGIAGGKAKCDFAVNELRYDACIDYKSGDIKEGLKEHCPKGVDVYFDNVGGQILDTVLTHINRRARIVLCGAISQYNSAEFRGPANYMQLLVNRARMEGFVVMDYIDRYASAVADILQWMKEGRFTSKEDVIAGLETFPETLLKLFSGENFGKLVLKVADD